MTAGAVWTTRGRAWSAGGTLAASPGPTAAQLAAVHAEFRRVGITGRGERLRLTAALAGRDGITSTSELSAGECGRVVRMLGGCRTVSDVRDAADPGRAGRRRARFRARLAGMMATANERR